MATHENQEFYLGEDWPLVITCHDADGEVINLTGGDVKFRLARAGATLLDLSVGNGVTLTDPVAGVATIRVTPTLQADNDVAAGLYVYEIRAIDAAGLVSEQADGSFNVRASLFAT